MLRLKIQLQFFICTDDVIFGLLEVHCIYTTRIRFKFFWEKSSKISYGLETFN